jgi:co-chaperonin GroES (HSP10)
MTTTKKKGIPPKTFTPFGNLVCLHVYRADETEGGIVLPDGVKDPSQTPTAYVVAVGPECKWAKEGQTVLAHPHTPGTKCRYKGHDYVLFNEDRLMGSVIDPGKEDNGAV